MINPWKEIALKDYENHMKLNSVMQLQKLNNIMKEQFENYPVTNVTILGAAGGNGLEHIKKDKYQKVYAIDINSFYLKKISERYKNLKEILKLICIDLREDHLNLPESQMVIANLLIEYIGYNNFIKTIKKINPLYVSCVIQVNNETNNFVSYSPYFSVFNKLEQIYNEIEKNVLEKLMNSEGFSTIKTLEYDLPNKKKFIRIDFKKIL